jgi:hypothetical protein
LSPNERTLEPSSDVQRSVTEALTPAQASVLHAIWVLESGNSRPQQSENGAFEPGVTVTTVDIANQLGLQTPYVRRILREIRYAFPDYITTVKCFPKTRHGHGRSALSFHLNQDTLVTFPETAAIFLQLLSSRPSDAFRIPRLTFEEETSQKLGLPVANVQSRIEWGLKVSYIESILPGFLHPMQKLHCDREYLQMLASDLPKGIG